MAAVKKIKLRANNGGAEIDVTPSAYQMRKSKYNATHTIVKEMPRIAPPAMPDPPAPPDDAPDTYLAEETAGNTQSQELDTHEEPTTKERKKPGPKPKNQDAQ